MRSLSWTAAAVQDEASFWGGGGGGERAAPRRPPNPREALLHDCPDELLLREVQRRAYNRRMSTGVSAQRMPVPAAA